MRRAAAADSERDAVVEWIDTSRPIADWATIAAPNRRGRPSRSASAGAGLPSRARSNASIDAAPPTHTQRTAASTGIGGWPPGQASGGARPRRAIAATRRWSARRGARGGEPRARPSAGAETPKPAPPRPAARPRSRGRGPDPRPGTGTPAARVASRTAPSARSAPSGRGASGAPARRGRSVGARRRARVRGALRAGPARRLTARIASTAVSAPLAANMGVQPTSVSAALSGVVERGSPTPPSPRSTRRRGHSGGEETSSAATRRTLRNMQASPAPPAPARRSPARRRAERERQLARAIASSPNVSDRRGPSRSASSPAGIHREVHAQLHGREQRDRTRRHPEPLCSHPATPHRGSSDGRSPPGRRPPPTPTSAKPPSCTHTVSTCIQAAYRGQTPVYEMCASCVHGRGRRLAAGSDGRAAEGEREPAGVPARAGADPRRHAGGDRAAVGGRGRGGAGHEPDAGAGRVRAARGRGVPEALSEAGARSWCRSRRGRRRRSSRRAG